MKHSDLKYYLGILLIFAIDVLHIIFYSNNERYDVYLFYDHTRYLTNILYDVSNLFRFSLLTFWLISIRKSVFIPLFVMSVAMWFTYFLFYNQMWSLILIPLYLLTVFIYNKKN